MPIFPTAASIMFTAAALGIVYGFWDTMFLHWATAIGIVAAGIAIWPFAHGQSRHLAAVFLLVAAGASYWASVGAAIEGAARIAEIIAMLLSAQILNDAIIYGGYDHLVRTLLMRLRWRPTWVALVGGYILTWGFALTSMPVVYSSLFGSSSNDNDGPSHRASPAQVNTAVLLARSFASAAIAAPIQPTVLLAVAITGASLVSFLIWVVPLTGLMLLVALVDMRRRNQVAITATTDPDLAATTDAGADAGAGTGTGADTGATESIPTLGRKEYMLLAGLFLSLGAATVTISMLPVRVVAGMAAVICISAFVWGPVGRRVLLDGRPAEQNFLRDTATGYSKRMADGVLLIGAGGIAGFTLTHTPIMDAAAAVLKLVTVPAFAAVLTMAVVIGLRLLGVAPAVIIITIGPVLMDTLPLGSVALAALLSAGSGMAFVISPFSITSAMASSLTGWSPVEVSLSRQSVFAIVGSLAAAAYVTIFL